MTEFARRKVEELSASRRAEIAEAATKQFAIKGYRATSVDDIAAELGATKGVIYHYFKSKGGILAEVQLRAIQAIHDNLLEAKNAGGEPADVLYEALRRHTLIAMQHAHMGRTYFAEQADVPPTGRQVIRKAAAASQRMLHGILQDGISQGVFRELPVQATAASLMSLCNGPGQWYRSNRGLSEERVAELCAELALASVLQRSDHATGEPGAAY